LEHRAKEFKKAVSFPYKNGVESVGAPLIEQLCICVQCLDSNCTVRIIVCVSAK